MSYHSAIQALHRYHDAAVALITPGSENRNFALQTISGMNPSHFMAMKEQVRKTGETIVALICDTTLPAPRLEHVWVMRPTEVPEAIARGDDLDLIIDCKLWSAANDGPVLIIGPDELDGHFVVSVDGARLVARPGKPVKDLTRGTARASERIARLAKSRTFVPSRGATMFLAA